MSSAWIYKAVRTRTIDYTLWAIVGLFGIAIWLSRGFLITCQMYDWATWIVCLLIIGSYLVPKQSKASRWIKGGALSSLSLAVIGFVTLNTIAKQKVTQHLILMKFISDIMANHLV